MPASFKFKIKGKKLLWWKLPKNDPAWCVKKAAAIEALVGQALTALPPAGRLTAYHNSQMEGGTAGVYSSDWLVVIHSYKDGLDQAIIDVSLSSLPRNNTNPPIEYEREVWKRMRPINEQFAEDVAQLLKRHGLAWELSVEMLDAKYSEPTGIYAHREGFGGSFKTHFRKHISTPLFATFLTAAGIFVWDHIGTNQATSANNPVSTMGPFLVACCIAVFRGTYASAHYIRSARLVYEVVL